MTAINDFRSRYATGTGDTPVQMNAGRKQLITLCTSLGYRVGAEIGVWEGEFSEQLCKGIQGLRLTCVDPWMASPSYNDPKNDAGRLAAAYQETVTRLTPYDCQILRMTSLEAAERVPAGSLDFVYIDGNHGRKAVAADLAAWVPKVRSGGIVAGHDYTRNKPWIQVPEVIDAYTVKHRIAPWFVLGRDKSPTWFWVKS
jgi:hypothetical protein